jgi:UDP-glucose 4-epimerase
MSILVTGGAGYIGSHTCVELMAQGEDVVIVDNLVNSSVEALARIGQIAGREPVFYQVDILDRLGLDAVFANHTITAVIHFAGLKAVGESVSKPLHYYQNNIAGTLTLCEVMEKFGVFNMVFSSSATVYGDPASVPIREDFPLSATNPYGQSKLFVEQVLRDAHIADSRWNAVLLRYFNPVGAHHSGLIGEDPQGIPNNLVPFISQVAVGKLQQLSVFGDNYPTPDGTGVRDYIHVVDLARGHLQALRKIADNPGVVAYNLGTGSGYSVLEMIAAFARISGRPIPYQVVARRPGDIAECYADPATAAEQLQWRAEFGLDRMLEDSWRWQSKNPAGYREA